MVEQATKEEAILQDTHGGEPGDKKGLKGGKALNKKTPRVTTQTRKVKACQE